MKINIIIEKIFSVWIIKQEKIMFLSLKIEIYVRILISISFKFFFNSIL